MSDSKFANIAPKYLWEKPDGANSLEVTYTGWGANEGIWEGETNTGAMMLVTSKGVDDTNSSPALGGAVIGDYQVWFDAFDFKFAVSTGGNSFTKNFGGGGSFKTNTLNLQNQQFKVKVEIVSATEIKTTLSRCDQNGAVVDSIYESITQAEVTGDGEQWPTGGFNIAGSDVAGKKKEVMVGCNNRTDNFQWDAPWDYSGPSYGVVMLPANVNLTFDPPAGPPPLAEKSKAVNVYNDAGDKKTKLKYDADGDFEIFVEDTKTVYIENIKFKADGIKQNVLSRIQDVETTHDNEKTNRDTKHTELTTLISANTSAVGGEQTRALAAETALSTAIDTEQTTRLAQIMDISNVVAAHKNTSETQNTARQSGIATANAAISDEVTRATNVEADISQNLAAEIVAARAAEAANADNINVEYVRAKAAEDDLSDAITALTSSAGGDVTLERDRALAAELVLRGDISANAQAIHDIVGSSPTQLNSLVELVADYQANGATVTTALNDLSGNAMGKIATLETQMAAVQAMLLALQQP